MAINKEVQFTAGEGLVVSDLQNMQRFAKAQILDAYGRECRTDGSFLGNNTICFSRGTGANVIITGLALQSSNNEGLILQRTGGTITGDVPDTLSYYLAPAELLTTHAAAHATLERWDIVCLKLTEADGTSTARDFKDATTGAVTTVAQNKQRQVVLTKQVVQGTNAAVGSATEPAIPAGFMKWAAVLVPPTYATAFVANSHFRDYRVPMDNYVSGACAPTLFNNIGGTQFPTTNSTNRAATAAGQNATLILPISSVARYMNLRFYGKITAGGGGSIDLYSLTSHLGTSATLTALGGGTFGTTAGVMGTKNLITSGVLAQSAGGILGTGPVWGRGRQVPLHTTGGALEFLLLSVTSGASGDYIAWVDYEIAGA
jgi:hypothetical protein